MRALAAHADTPFPLGPIPSVLLLAWDWGVRDRSTIPTNPGLICAQHAHTHTCTTHVRPASPPSGVVPAASVGRPRSTCSWFMHLVYRITRLSLPAPPATPPRPTLPHPPRPTQVGCGGWVSVHPVPLFQTSLHPPPRPHAGGLCQVHGHGLAGPHPPLAARHGGPHAGVPAAQGPQAVVIPPGAYRAAAQGPQVVWWLRFSFTAHSATPSSPPPPDSEEPVASRGLSC